MLLGAASFSGCQDQVCTAMCVPRKCHNNSMAACGGNCSNCTVRYGCASERHESCIAPEFPSSQAWPIAVCCSGPFDGRLGRRLSLLSRRCLGSCVCLALPSGVGPHESLEHEHANMSLFRTTSSSSLPALPALP
jgi:hypothetical protein